MNTLLKMMMLAPLLLTTACTSLQVKANDGSTFTNVNTKATRLEYIKTDTGIVIKLDGEVIKEVDNS